MMKIPSRYPIYCNECGAVKQAHFIESGANGSPMWLRCICGSFDIIAPWHRYGGWYSDFGAPMPRDMYLSRAEAEKEVSTYDSADKRNKALCVIRSSTNEKH